MNSVNAQINPKYKNKLSQGYPLIEKETLSNWPKIEEGTLLSLYSGKDFVATAYYGRQNKGYGWVVSNKQEVINEHFMSRVFEAAMNKRKNFEDDPITNAYRIFNGEGDGFGGITVDYLDGHYLVTWYSRGIYRMKDMILSALKELVDFKSIYEKKRFDTKGQYLEDDDFVCGLKPDFPIDVVENGVHFPVYLNDGPMIGFFLDQKNVRKAIRDTYSKGKTVLNTFSYTGAFSVYAALGGATNTTSVDLANRSRAKTTEVFEVNGVNLEQQKIIVEDVFEYFKYANRKKLLFDVVILDPPSFARSKKHTFSAAKDYSKLAAEALNITEVGGLVVASTNHSGFGMKKFKQMIEKAAKIAACSYRIEEAFGLPSDFSVIPEFPEGNYLKVLFVRKTS